MAKARHRILTWRMVVAALLVGVVLAVVSVPVAAYALDHRASVDEDRVKGFYFRTDGHEVLVRRVAYFAATLWDTSSRPAGPDMSLVHMQYGLRASQHPPDGQPVVSKTSLDRQHHNVRYIQIGWPFRAAYGTWEQRFSQPTTRRVVGIYEPTIRGRERTFPYLPLWPGLLANTLFYAALALTPMVLLRWRRTRRRRARGLCVACGYELGEGVSVCPECGLGREMGKAIER